MGHGPCAMGPWARGHGPCAMGHAPWAMGYEPCAMGHGACAMWPWGRPWVMRHGPCAMGPGPNLTKSPYLARFGFSDAKYGLFDTKLSFSTPNLAFSIPNSPFRCQIHKSSYADRHEIAQRCFFGPSGGKSSAVHPLLILPRPNFILFFRCFSRRLRPYLAQPHQMRVEYAVVLSYDYISHMFYP